jgi:hypothetical protein
MPHLLESLGCECVIIFCEILHWVATSGTEPTFWKALEKKKLLSCLPDFAGNLTMKVARNVFELRVDGKLLMPDAMNKSIDKCKAERYHGIEEWTLEPAETQTAIRCKRCIKTFKQ